MTPDISVLISTYNGAHTIGRALASIFNSLQSRIEVCVCDDNSNDDTPELLAKYAEDLKTVRVIRHAENRGTAEGLNSAASIATGKHFIILGDDDYFQRGALDILHAALNGRDDVQFVYGSTRYYGAQERIHVPPAFNAADFFKTFVSLYAVMYKREAWDKGMRYRDLITLEGGRGLGACDYDFVLQMIDAGYQGLALPDVLVLNYLYNPSVRQTRLVDLHQAEMVAKFKQQWAKWEGNAL